MAGVRRRALFPTLIAALAGCVTALGPLKLASGRLVAAEDTVRLGGKPVSAAVLTAGRESFMNRCAKCHGEKGDGRGWSAEAEHPLPRDFTRGQFKFGGVPAGALPTDEGLMRVVVRGLKGTAMPPWDGSSEELEAVIQYIKTFSPRWEEEEPGEPIATSPDPFGQARKEQAIEKGKKLYHAVARCGACHPHYVTREELRAFAREQGDEQTEPRPNMYRPVWTDSEYGEQLLPSDFLSSIVRAGTTEEDLYRTIASGIGGTAMPTWKGALPEEDLWAIVHYVKSLLEMKDTPKGRALRMKMASDFAEAASER
ncbi:MAG: c-type cytochrome [Myxococcales bacterium]|nr:c-type cytochrome [Myxococcales bacterium]